MLNMIWITSQLSLYLNRYKPLPRDTLYNFKHSTKPDFLQGKKGKKSKNEEKQNKRKKPCLAHSIVTD